MTEEIDPFDLSDGPARAFRNVHLSVSRLKLYEACPRAFFYRYVEPRELADDEKVPMAEAPAFGVALHDALERLFVWVVEEEFSGRIPEGVLMGYYREAWAASHLTGLGLFQEGIAILRAYLGEHPDIDSRNILAVEREFNLQVGEFLVNGYIDRIDKIDDETVEIIDYKSNRMLFSRDEVDSDLQMSVYGLVARELFPWAKTIRFAFHMLRHGVVQATERTPASLLDTKEYIVALGRRTEAKDATFPPKLNSNCAYCDARGRCDAYKNALAKGYEPVKVDIADLEAVSRERTRVHILAKAAYARKEELDRLIKARLKDVPELVAGGYSYRMISISDVTYPRDKTVGAFVSAGLPRERVEERLLNISAKAVKALLEEISEEKKLDAGKKLLLETKIGAFAKREVTQQRIDAREIKEKKK